MSDFQEDGTQQRALERLLLDLVRDGWLMGMNAGMDPALVRMDPETGVFARAHFERLAQVAVQDAGTGRCRTGDGPATGSVAVVAVRVAGFWEEDHEGRSALVRRVAEALDTILRADDVLGRVEPDAFALLLRGCPPAIVERIAARCAEVAGAGRSGSAFAATWDGGGPDLVERALMGLLQ